MSHALVITTKVRQRSRRSLRQMPAPPSAIVAAFHAQPNYHQWLRCGTWPRIGALALSHLKHDLLFFLPLISAAVTPNSAITARIFAMSMVRDKARVEQPVGKMEVLLLDIMCAPNN